MATAALTNGFEQFQLGLHAGNSPERKIPGQERRRRERELKHMGC